MGLALRIENRKWIQKAKIDPAARTVTRTAIGLVLGVKEQDGRAEGMPVVYEEF